MESISVKKENHLETSQNSLDTSYSSIGRDFTWKNWPHALSLNRTLNIFIIFLVIFLKKWWKLRHSTIYGGRVIPFQILWFDIRVLRQIIGHFYAQNLNLFDWYLKKLPFVYKNRIVTNNKQLFSNISQINTVPSIKMTYYLT